MQMRSTMGAIPILLAMGAIPAIAGSVSYTLNFSASYGVAPISGSFVYENTANSFTSFAVNWDALAFNLTAAANSPSALGVSQVPCIAAASGAQASFLAFTSCAGTYGGLEWDALGGSSDGFISFFFAGQGGFGTPIFQLDITGVGEGINPYASGGTVTSTLQGGGNSPGAPEPGTIGLSALGGALLLFAMRRQQNHRATRILGMPPARH